MLSAPSLRIPFAMLEHHCRLSGGQPFKLSTPDRAPATMPSYLPCFMRCARGTYNLNMQDCSVPERRKRRQGGGTARTGRDGSTASGERYPARY